MNIRNIIESHISHEDAEIFAEWAFGPEFRTINLCFDAHKYWNERHRFILTLKPEGKPTEDIPRMIELWNSWKDDE